MLDPNGRALYADSLRPPPGRVFDEAIATTYTLGLDTLLSVPLQLALFDRRDAGEGIRDGVAVLEALRRTSERLSVFYQAGRIHVPSTRHVLYGMLEPVVHAVRAPGGGAFHAKLWVLRFVDPEGGSRRCCVCSCCRATSPSIAPGIFRCVSTGRWAMSRGRKAAYSQTSCGDCHLSRSTSFLRRTWRGPNDWPPTWPEPASSGQPDFDARASSHTGWAARPGSPRPLTSS